MEFAATTMGVFIAGKTLNGFSLGVIQASCVSYVADISPLPLRGLSTALCNISFSIGPLVVFIINYCVANFKTRWAYRAMLSSQWGFAAVSLVLMLLIPESPTYYILQGKVDKAEQAYRRLLGDPVAAVNQVTVVKETVLEAEKISEGSTYLDCFKGVNLKRTMVSCVPFMSTSFSGVAFTGSYTTYFFQLSGLDEQKSFQYTCGAQAISIGGCIASLFIVDRFGRRNNLIYGLLSICLCDLIIGATATASDSKPEVLNVCIGFMMLYGGIYNAGLGSVCYPICAENPTSALRTKTVALGLASGNLFSMMWSFVIPYVFNPDQANLGGKTMFIFFGISVLIWVHIFFFQTETAGRSYDEIDEMYASGIPLRKFQHYTSKLANIDVGLTEEEKAVQVKHVEEL
ncbi:MFS general substrate transporter [Yamadazyma tenuis ATCC 10573]|nr:MFS general substrate transporter [Yamadazyma tenuis ATCC 10573]EGV64551.1 MFS general substrate transporter [Yamadazyma tenuis ATCC 10573]